MDDVADIRKAELAVTPGAVGQQVRALERMLGIAPFRRLPRSLVLTAKGEAYLAATV
jgi:LysR family glycine cleavage system transcriptional activator